MAELVVADAEIGGAQGGAGGGEGGAHLGAELEGAPDVLLDRPLVLLQPLEVAPRPRPELRPPLRPDGDGEAPEARTDLPLGSLGARVRPERGRGEVLLEDLPVQPVDHQRGDADLRAVQVEGTAVAQPRHVPVVRQQVLGAGGWARGPGHRHRDAGDEEQPEELDDGLRLARREAREDLEPALEGLRQEPVGQGAVVLAADQGRDQPVAAAVGLGDEVAEAREAQLARRRRQHPRVPEHRHRRCGLPGGLEPALEERHDPRGVAVHRGRRREHDVRSAAAVGQLLDEVVDGAAADGEVGVEGVRVAGRELVHELDRGVDRAPRPVAEQATLDGPRRSERRARLGARCLPAPAVGDQQHPTPRGPPRQHLGQPARGLRFDDHLAGQDPVLPPAAAAQLSPEHPIAEDGAGLRRNSVQRQPVSSASH